MIEHSVSFISLEKGLEPSVLRKSQGCGVDREETRCGAQMHYAGNSEYMNQTRYESVQASLEVFKDAPLLFEPGTAYSYSTHGYTLLSAVLEAAAGKDFLSLMQQIVFAPLGIERTLPEYSDRDLESRATYYGPNPFVRVR